MNNGDKTFFQKIKDNAFYVALGIGLLAILAVVAVYTTEQSGTQLAENDVDLNMASDYEDITSEQPEENQIKETNGKTASKAGETSRITTQEDTVEEVSEEKKNTEEVLDGEDATQNKEMTDTQEQIPVTVDVGELDFTSDKTITWPVSGEVILPYSMDTTVYFKTLNQYQCNPGMLIAAGNGTTVKNAYLGKVTKVTSDNVYGNLVTLYIGNNYSIVYGQLDTIYVKEGEYVKEGQSIGTIGSPTDSFQEEGSHLFFQMLENDKPVDPSLYIE